MKNEKFERLLSEIRNEQVDDKMCRPGGRESLQVDCRGCPGHGP